MDQNQQQLQQISLQRLQREVEMTVSIPMDNWEYQRYVNFLRTISLTYNNICNFIENNDLVNPNKENNVALMEQIKLFNAQLIEKIAEVLEAIMALRRQIGMEDAQISNELRNIMQSTFRESMGMYFGTTGQSIIITIDGLPLVMGNNEPNTSKLFYKITKDWDTKDIPKVIIKEFGMSLTIQKNVAQDTQLDPLQNITNEELMNLLEENKQSKKTNNNKRKQQKVRKQQCSVINNTEQRLQDNSFEEELQKFQTNLESTYTMNNNNKDKIKPNTSEETTKQWKELVLQKKEEMKKRERV